LNVETWFDSYNVKFFFILFFCLLESYRVPHWWLWPT
jgi:hypothetical protein